MMFSIISILVFFEIANAADSKAPPTQWINLLYYSKNGDSYKSLVTNDGFFLTKEGKTNPIVEYQATKAMIISAMRSKQPIPERVKKFNCRFPARYEFIIKENDLTPQKILCPEFQTWKDSFEADGLSVLFASQYLTNPASAMGHTYLRIKSKNRALYLNKVISYSAHIPDETGTFEYAFKGITGGFKGFFSEDPYYFKFHEYSNIEQRDLWEYHLTLTQAQLDSYLMHLWELIQSAQFNYLFATENCSKMLLRSLQVVYKDINLVEQMPTLALPAEAMRVLQNSKFVSEITFYPSPASLVNEKYSQLSKKDKMNFLEVIQGNKLDQLELLDLAIDYYNFMRNSNGGKLSSSSQIVLNKLLVARSKFKNSNPIERIKGISPIHEANPPSRFGFGFGRIKEENYISLQFRPLAHDLLDKLNAYLKYSIVSLLDLKIKVFQDSYIGIDHLTLVSLQKLSSYEFASKDFSWGINATIESSEEYRCRKCYRFVLNPNWGIGKEYIKKTTGTILFDPKFNFGNLEKHYSHEPAVTLLNIIELSKWRIINSIRPYLYIDHQVYSDFSLKLILNRDIHYTFELSTKYNTQNKSQTSEFNLFTYF